ncbi:hypothetical protein AMES_1898 [Amycolatopsis mediterranei S699]|uniref:Uncharacterized protein n=2 Tax=Amycolatopsis mediterranei TaxID=33910 RepID=A0A0H3CYJ7_AMYMU|nr:hypothetical protein [Amycolatopsis mediterranei]ADJ43722.1 hypothetical protein AMED_1913 [Amycolatopsis mediterranei U32]AEK40431.1 hypothetical protein RAM_09705 [Amycolatopsis mediterranei S699]AFO75434.1 hypothetical protein AMES_1898 [Amycolatopsis mediterranei S699]AGT82563.1 hypothetical protein B737_1899 [Amycolatopsis mediterranei RB]KDO10185.1 hypothetical protein DV26_13645 [Amycolatopsis mediterranei]
MGAEIERADPSVPREREPDRDDTPTRFAHVRIETSEVKAEMAVPSSQTRRLLTTVLDVLVVLGAVLGPALTLKAASAGLPTWATAGTIAGQLALLTTVAVIAHRPEHPGRLPS